MWTTPRRYRLMKLKTGDAITVGRGERAVTGTLVHLETDGFWIGSADGMSYRFVLGDASSAVPRENEG